MINKAKKAFALLKAGDFDAFKEKTMTTAVRIPYRIRARIEDWRIGRVSVNGHIPSQFRQIGAYGTQSTDYRSLDHIFKTLPLRENDAFIDVGCGEGRVLTYLYLRGFRGKLTGIELNPDVAATAAARTKNCENIRILCANALECRDTLREATVIYLYNPFDDTVLSQFIRTIEECCDHPVRVYYCYDIYRHLLDKRENWSILRRNAVSRPGYTTMYYSIYKYMPPQDTEAQT